MKLPVVFAVPRFIEPNFLIKALSIQVRQDQNPPTVQRLAIFIDCVRRWKFIVYTFIIEQSELDIFYVVQAVYFRVWASRSLERWKNEEKVKKQIGRNTNPCKRAEMFFQIRFISFLPNRSIHHRKQNRRDEKAGNDSEWDNKLRGVGEAKSQYHTRQPRQAEQPEREMPEKRGDPPLDQLSESGANQTQPRREQVIPVRLRFPCLECVGGRFGHGSFPCSANFAALRVRLFNVPHSTRFRVRKTSL